MITVRTRMIIEIRNLRATNCCEFFSSLSLMTITIKENYCIPKGRMNSKAIIKTKGNYVLQRFMNFKVH